MKRRNTACQTMIDDFKALKAQGVTDFICHAYIGRIGEAGYKRFKPVIKHTAQGVSAYANRTYDKYGDDLTVEVGYFDNNFNWVGYTTYHA